MKAWLTKILEKQETTINLSEIPTKNCWHDWSFQRGELVCTTCGLINLHEQLFVVDRIVIYEFWPRTYLRRQYFDSLFNKITGKEPLEYSDKHRFEFIQEMPDPCDWYQVYQQFKEYSLKDWWTCWNVFSYCEKLIDYKPIHYKLLCYIDNHWENNERAKKKINVFYTLFKIVEMTECNVRWVPMKLRLIAITRLDEEWKEICHKLGWKFKPTNKKLTKFAFMSTWPKR